MSLPRYPKYKDSGVEWLGEVPEHWEVVPLKWLTDPKRPIMYGIVLPGPDVGEGGIPILKGGNVKPSRMNLSSMARTTPELEAPYARARLKAEDLAYSIRGSIGDCERVPTELEGANITQDVARVAISPANNAGWARWALLAPSVREALASGSLGAAVRGINIFDLKRARIPTPPLAEQNAMTSFLDRETAKIDALVAEQQRLIELLKEKRQAVISHAVTKGMNPDVPMKDSGIAWLGEVPAHWRTTRGRFLFDKAEVLPESGDGVVTAFRDGQVTLRENRRSDGFTLAVLEVGYQRVHEGDLVIHGMDAFAGAIGVSESTGKCTPEYSVLTRAHSDVDNHYFAEVLRLMARRNYIFVICPSVRERAPRFRFEAFKDVLLPVPPIDEQRAIVRMAGTLALEARRLTAEAQRAIDLLQERRTALISAAVTGQIDVRSSGKRASA